MALTISILYSITIFLSAFLLFSIQPIFAKRILPLLGGTPQVWNTCMLCFQAALLAGYLYTHKLVQKHPLNSQRLVHGAALCTAFFLLNLKSHLPAPPQSGLFGLWAAKTFFYTLGFPFCVLASTAPLLQKWFTQTQKTVRPPYFLYSISNAGSLLALLGYPFFIEPLFKLSDQISFWQYGYGLLGILIFACACFLRYPDQTADQLAPLSKTAPSTQPSLLLKIEWLFFAFVPSSLVLGVTTYISTDVAAVPLLWLIPLAIYLITFILAFSKFDHKLLTVSVRIFPHSILILSLLIGQNLISSDLRWILIFHIANLFITASLFHGYLAKLKPSHEHLTSFYLWISFGGMLGGMMNSLAAPVLFKSVIEYPVTLGLACFGWLMLQYRTSSKTPAGLLSKFDLLAPLLLAGLFYLNNLLTPQTDTTTPMFFGNLYGKLFLCFAVLLCFSFKNRPVCFTLGIMCFLGIPAVPSISRKTMYQTRSYFGTHRIVMDSQNNSHYYVHGTTLHGEQYLDPKRSREPTRYFSREGPAGQALTLLDDLLQNKQIGVIGLGTGTLYAFFKPGQNWTFYEIDPTVKRIAENAAWFSYLSSNPRGYTIVLGDGRLSLAKEPSGKFSAILIDAFSSDSIPIHLLTQEAILIYFDKLTLDGFLLFHISNRHLNLQLPLGALGEELNVFTLTQEHPGSAWVMMTKSEEIYMQFVKTNKWHEPQIPPHFRPWTDDYSNLASTLKK